MKWVACDMPTQVGFLFWDSKIKAHFFTDKCERRHRISLYNNAFRFDNDCLWRCCYCRANDAGKYVLRIYDVLLFNGAWLVHETDVNSPCHDLNMRNQLVKLFFVSYNEAGGGVRDDIRMEFSPLHDMASSVMSCIHEVSDIALLQRAVIVTECSQCDVNSFAKKPGSTFHKVTLRDSKYGPPLWLLYDEEMFLGTVLTKSQQVAGNKINVVYDWCADSYSIT